MALKILENKGVFYLKGKINNTTTRDFIIHFDYVLDATENVMINVDKIDEIDAEGVEAIRTLMRIAEKNNKTFSIVTHCDKEIYDNFKCSQVA